MDDLNNQKEKLAKLIKELGASIDKENARKIDFKKLERISSRLIEYLDECTDCQEYVNQIITNFEVTSNFTNLQDKQVLLNYHRTLKAIVSHMEKKHKLITEGYFMSIYMCLGISLGSGLGVALNNLALWMSIGLCIGMSIGSGIDSDYKKKGKVI